MHWCVLSLSPGTCCERPLRSATAAHSPWASTSVAARKDIFKNWPTTRVATAAASNAMRWSVNAGCTASHSDFFLAPIIMWSSLFRMSCSTCGVTTRGPSPTCCLRPAHVPPDRTYAELDIDQWLASLDLGTSQNSCPICGRRLEVESYRRRRLRLARSPPAQASDRSHPTSIPA